MSQESSSILILIQKFSETINNDDEIPCKGKLEKIKETLHQIQPKVSATLPQVTLDMLSDLLYELDDVLQECLALSNKQKEGKLSLSNICSPIKLIPLSSNLNKLENRLIDIEETIKKQLPANYIEHETKDFPDNYEKPYEWTTSFIDETKIYGWDDDVEKIVEPLIKDDNNKYDKFSAIGIVGLYGCGKTALAQKIFVHDKVKDTFPLRLWVCVSPDCKRDELIYRMLDNLGLEEDQVNGIIESSEVYKKNKDSKIGVLLFILHLMLLDIRYLIVFDDVRYTDDWYRNLTFGPPEEGEWNDRLAYSLPKGNGSAVIVTARREDQAKRMVETGHIYRPKPLDIEQGWKLFTRTYKEVKGEMPIKEEDMKEQEKLKEEKLKEYERMKGEIVKKCLGLPIAFIAAAEGLGEEDLGLVPKKEEEPEQIKQEEQIED